MARGKGRSSIIQVTRKYSIAVNDSNYTVVEVKKKKGQEDIITPLTYHDSIESALNRIGKFIATDALISKDMKLSEAIETLQIAINEYREEIKKAIPNVKVVE